MRQKMLLSVFFLLMLAIPATASVLDKPRDFTLTYGVYGGGFQALTIDLHFKFSPTTYRVTMDAKPYGVLGHLLPWAGQYDTQGVVRKNVLTPQHHEKRSGWRDDHSHLTMTYDRTGRLIKQMQEETSGKKTKMTEIPVASEMSKDAVDITTGIVRMMVAANDHDTCTHESMIYDGKRRFRMVFKDKGREKLADSKINIARGTARRCQLELVPVLGFKGTARGDYMIQEQARALGALPLVWVAPLWQGGPAVPVRMLVKSDFGSVFIHVQKVLTNY